MRENRKALDNTYAEVQQAAHTPKDHTLTLHMWEKRLNWDLNLQDAQKPRSEELDTVFSMMSGDPDAHYNDKFYFRPKTDEKPNWTGFPNRAMRGSKNGLMGLATTPITNQAVIPAFTQYSETGLLLLDAPPVLVSPHDAWTVYVSNDSEMATQAIWQELHDFVKKRHADNIHQFAHPHLTTPEDRQRLVGKLTMLRTNVDHPLYNILHMQAGDDGNYIEGGPWIQVDPTSPEVQSRARDAYTQLMEKVNSGEHVYPLREHDDYPEVGVNAKLEHAAGIVAANTSEATVDPEKPWSDTLSDNVKLAKTLYSAINEREQLHATLKENGISRVPTIVIYQPQSEYHKMVHFPPTERNKQLVEGVLRQKGELPAKGAHLE